MGAQACDWDSDSKKSNLCLSRPFVAYGQKFTNSPNEKFLLMILGSQAKLEIDLDEIGMKERIKIEIERHKKFQSGLLGIKEQSVKVGDVDVRNYAKYILRDGTIFEKRELLTCLRSKITMAKKEIRIA